MSKQENLFPGIPLKSNDNTKEIGANFSLTFNRKNKSMVTLKHRDIIIKKVDVSDKIARKLLIIELVESGAIKSRLADALNISRQTIDNYIGSKEAFGIEGLLGGYNPNMGKNLAEHRKATQDKRMSGNKAVILAEKRKAKRIENLTKQEEFDFEFGEKNVPKDDQPFNTLHEWKATRYAGVFLYLIILISTNKWLKLLMGWFGDAYKIFLVFLLMVARNIGSIEQLKNINQKEAGLILGLNKLPHKKIVWQWFYTACNLRYARFLCRTFFKHQLKGGVISNHIWFTDGHLLPYTGNQKVHSGFNTQRKMMMPGQTNMVTCDISGRIVDFQIQEGKGDLKEYIVELKENWKDEMTEIPIMVFDREGSGAPFFNNLMKNEIPFVTWEKHVNTEKLWKITDDCFTESFEMNNKKYRIFEGEKIFSLEQDEKTKIFVLRKIYLWNLTSKRRTCGLAWDAGKTSISTLQFAQAVLSRWGASENTFKHIYDKHPFHYHPGFKTENSEKQLIANPAIKSIEKKIRNVRKDLDKKHKKNSKTKQVFNKDGSKRKNSLKSNLETEISELEVKYKKLLNDKQQLDEKVDVSTLEDYKIFKKIDNEGKNLFDFVTASMWNARKDMTDWLLCHYPYKNEYVDLFYAITQCHGWIMSEADRVVVRLEPLQQPSRRKAQEQLCRKLNALNAYIPIGKILQIEVGCSPI